MRIALYHHLPSGGALGHFSEVVEALKEAGHELALFIPATAEQDFGNLKDKVDHVTVFQRSNWKPILPFLNPMLYKTYLGQHLTEEKHYVKFIKEFNPDGIYLGQCRLWTEPPLLRYLPKDIPSVLYCAEPKRSFYEKRFLDERKKWPIWKKFWRLPTIEWMKGEMYETILKADHVQCNSQYSQAAIKHAYKGLEAKVTYVGVDTQKFRPAQNQEKKKQLLSVGALDPSKNHNMVIEVAACLPEDLGFKVVIVTDRSYGETADQLRALAKEKEVELEIRERIPIEELIQTYQESFATIYCPILEPFGRVSIESQACGTPVIGRNEGGVKETVDPKLSGGLFLDQAQDYTNLLEKWIDCPKTYQNMVKGAIENVQKNWDSKQTLKSHIDFLEKVYIN